MQPKYPHVKVRLTGIDSNGLVILGRVQEALRHAKLPETRIREFTMEAKSGDYDHLLQTCMKWVDVS